MKLAVNLLVLLSLLTMLNTARSEEPPLYNIDDFVLFGVSMDDTGDKVIKGLSEYFSISPDELDIQTNYSGSQVLYVDYDEEGIRVRTYLDGKVDGQPALDYMSAGIKTDDFDAFLKDAIDQYGPLSLTVGKNYFWCEKVSDAKDRCEANFGSLRIRYSAGRMSASFWKNYTP